MKLRTLLLFCTSLLFCNLVSAQYLNIPSPGVVNTPINFANTSGLSTFSNNHFYTNANNFSIYNNPLTNFSTYTFASNLLQTPAFSDLAFDGTNYHLFTSNYGGGVIRWDFGTNIMSTPTAYSIPGLSSLQQQEGITIRKEGNNWYGFVCSNNATQRLTRLDFGTNLANPTPAITNLGVLTLSWPHEMTIIDDGGNWYGFVANRNTKVTRLDFGTSLTNAPTSFVYNDPNIVSPCNLRVVNDASNWYLFSINLFNGEIVRTDLGNNLGNNTPVYNNMGEPHPTVGIARGLTIIQDCNGVRGILCDEASNLFDLSFAGNSITGAITGTPTSTINLPNGNFNDFTPFWNNDTLYYFVTNPYSYVGRVQINPTLSAGNQSSIAFSPTFTYPMAGAYNISCLINTGSSGMRSQCAPIIINTIATINRIKCPGDTIMLSNNTIISVPGTYNDTLQDINNQDSVISVVFSNYPIYNDTDTVNICQGQSYTLPSNIVVSAAGVYSDTLITINGCDSIINTTLFINPTYTNTISDTICGNMNYQLPGGSTVNTTGVYQDNFLTTTGCDSIIITNLQVQPAYQINIFDTICGSATYTLPDATIVNTTGVYITPFTTTENCDSIITTNLQVNQNKSSNESISLCNQSSYNLPNGSNVTSSGQYISIIPASNGCDSTITTIISFNTSSASTEDVKICFNDTYTLPDNSIVSAAGQYVTTTMDNNGCDSVVTTNLTIAQLPIVDLGPDQVICNNESIVLNASTPNATYLWNDQNNSGIREISSSGFYEVQVTVEPCPPVVDLIYIAACDCQVFIPNAFTPNGDGNNDIFKPVINCNIVSGTYVFHVYNRWGERVFESSNPNDGWSGKQWTQLQPNGTYFYFLKFKNAESNKEIKYKGDINLLK